MENIAHYDRPIQIADGIHWVGYRDEKTRLVCNPYLAVSKDQAVLIDGGSRADFPLVMMKILQAGVDPRQIVALIYQHYDPDLCGSMASFIDLCENKELRVFSDRHSSMFIAYYMHRDQRGLLREIDAHGLRLTFGERVLRFIRTPYCHSPGSFVTYDVATRTLFSSDLFGSFSNRWDLRIRLPATCYDCRSPESCPRGAADCPVRDILDFHRTLMPCNKALRHAMGCLKALEIDRVAPQHGSLIYGKRDIRFLIEKLEQLDGVGIDGHL